MAIKETRRFFGLFREINLTPEQVEQLQKDTVTRHFCPNVLKGKIRPDGSARVRGLFSNNKINYIKDAAVEGGIFT